MTLRSQMEGGLDSTRLHPGRSPSGELSSNSCVEPLPSSKLWIVLPAFNEAENLPPLLERICRTMTEHDFRYEILLVDDGSTDATPNVAKSFSEKMPIEVIDHSFNQGLGRSLQTGLRTACRYAAASDVIVTMDADNTQPPESIPHMAELIRGGRDLVIASRFRRGAAITGVPANRNLISYFGRFLFKAVHPIPGARDYTSGFRAFRARLLQDAFDRYGDGFISEAGFAAMSEILLKLRPLHPRVGEIPLILRYDLKRGGSKLKLFRTVWKTMTVILRRRIGM